jgi:hypothetical protein
MQTLTEQLVPSLLELVGVGYLRTTRHRARCSSKLVYPQATEISSTKRNNI